MDINIFIAVLGGLINMILSLIIPYFLKDVKQPFLNEINTIYTTYRQLIITSSLIVALTIYITLNVGPNLEDMVSSWYTNTNLSDNRVRFTNLSGLGGLTGSSCNDNFNNSFYNNNDNIKLFIDQLSSDN
jgi:phosphotransferase system  glucose/maltose/N-acetylglucosamine-specific IIC component